MVERPTVPIRVSVETKGQLDNLLHRGQTYGGLIDEMLAFILDPDYETRYRDFNRFQHIEPKETKEGSNGKQTD